MANLFKRKKSPADLVASIQEALADGFDPERRDAQLEKSVTGIKNYILGEGDKEANPTDVAAMAAEIHGHHLFNLFVRNFSVMDMKINRMIVLIFNNLIALENSPTVNYIATMNPKLLDELTDGYNSRDTAMLCGSLLQTCIPERRLAEILLTLPAGSPSVYKYFEFVKSPEFEVASDAFETLQRLLLTHEDLTATFLTDNYEQVFPLFDSLLVSGKYMVFRQVLTLLGDLITIPAGFRDRYLADVENLKMVMQSLNDDKSTIQMAAYHVFKVFIVNPNKSDPVLDILLKNQELLLQYLSTFQTEREDDAGFMDDRSQLITLIADLKPRELTPEEVAALEAQKAAAAAAAAAAAHNDDDVAFDTDDDTDDEDFVINSDDEKVINEDRPPAEPAKEGDAKPPPADDGHETDYSDIYLSDDS